MKQLPSQTYSQIPSHEKGALQVIPQNAQNENRHGEEVTGRILVPESLRQHPIIPFYIKPHSPYEDTISSGKVPEQRIERDRGNSDFDTVSILKSRTEKSGSGKCTFDFIGFRVDVVDEAKDKVFHQLESRFQLILREFVGHCSGDVG